MPFFAQINDQNDDIVCSDGSTESGCGSDSELVDDGRDLPVFSCMAEDDDRQVLPMDENRANTDDGQCSVMVVDDGRAYQ